MSDPQAMTNAEEAGKAWEADFQKLPEERQEAMKRWFGLQSYLAHHLGLEQDAWMAHVKWAFDHPFDYSFVADFPALAAAMAAGDGFERAQSSAALIGQTEMTPTTKSPTSGNSLFDFMLGRADEDESINTKDLSPDDKKT